MFLTNKLEKLYVKLDHIADATNKLPRPKFLFMVFGFACLWSRLVAEGMVSAFVIFEGLMQWDFGWYYTSTSYQDLTFLEFAILAPLLETLIFQFALQNIVRTVFGDRLVSIGITVLTFSILHFTNNFVSGINAMGVGLALCMTYEGFRIKNGHFFAFLITTLAHMIWNGTLAYSFLNQ